MGKQHVFTIPPDLDEAIAAIAQEGGITPLEFIKQSIKLGILAAATENSPEAELVFRDNRSERKVSIFGKHK